MGAPVRFQKAVSRSKEKRRGEAPIGAPVRVMGRLFPPAGGTGFAVRLSHRVRRSAPALVGALPPRFGGHPQTAAGRPLPRNDGAWSDERCAAFNGLSCPAHAGHPVIINVSDYWIARWSLSSGRPKAGPVGGR